MTQWIKLVDILKERARKLSNEELDEIFLNDMKEALFKLYGKEREGIHVTDITSCIKKKVYEKLYPSPITTQQLNWFVTGKAVGNIIEELAESLDSKKYTGEKELKSPSEKMQGHVDLYNNLDRLPIELKTTRMDAAQLISKGPNFGYLLQLAMYIAFTKTKKGLLYYKLLSNRTENFDHGFTLELEDSDIAKINEEAERLVSNYEIAITKENPDIAETVYDNPDLSFQCRWCPYSEIEYCAGGNQVKRKMISQERAQKLRKDLKK